MFLTLNDMMFNKWRLSYVVIPLLMLSSCERIIDYDYFAWHVDNRFTTSVAVLTVHSENDQIVSSKYYRINPTIIYPDGIYIAEGWEETVRNELERHPDMTIYFTIYTEGMDIYDIDRMIKNSIAWFTPTYSWLEDHSFTIRFPRDCTVNPDLGELYNLDEFVEQYGALNGRGWSDVWERWQQHK